MWVYIFQLSIDGHTSLEKISIQFLEAWYTDTVSGATSSFTSSRISRGSKIVIENWVDILFALGRKCFQHGN